MHRTIKSLFFFLILFSSIHPNAYTHDDWEVARYEDQSYAIVSGEIQYSDKFSFVLSPDEQCEEVSSMFSFFTWNNPGDFDQLIGRRVPIKLNDIETTAEVLSTFPYKEGIKVVFYFGTFPLKEYIYTMYKYYESEGIYQIQIVDGLNFNANKYFDITENNWKFNKLISSVYEAYEICKSINDKNI